ncbi:glycoside hydrolase family 5 protein [Nonomuraea basaltis]|uniref:glycoside hydrolase family 5 protein n=1 Tax=Nonomuraea basaltis TaxID=2495887 RepID=UPI00110C52A1|nr:cellulase family glycosylhydrolase [Nonomuraea basaltis]TMR90986.1 glycoside hydrolase family 5 protein [Nonomuraea basaltis]
MRQVVVSVLALVAVLVAGALADPSGLVALYKPWGGSVLYVCLLVTGFAAMSYGLRRTSGFFMTWGLVIVVAMVARFADSLIMVLGTVPSWSTVRYAGWSSGYTGLFAAIFGWIVALAAVVAKGRAAGRRLDEGLVEKGGRGGRRRPLRLTIIAAATSLLAMPVIGHEWWAASPAAYAYHGWSFIAPAPDAGFIGAVAGVVVFAGGVHLSGIRGGGRWTAFATGWLACVCGGLLLGLVQSLLAAVADITADDLWPVPATFLRLSAGASYGAAVGLVASPLALIRLGRLASVVPVTAALSLLVLPVSSGTTLMATATARDGLPRLMVTRNPRPVISDESGRQVLLRGVNVNQLNDYWTYAPNMEASRPLSEADFAGMAAMGFDVVRLAVSWSRLEPTPGAFDTAYVNQIRQAVDQGAAHDMYTVIDLHQDAWGKFVAADEDTSCPAGTDPMIGWDGAPEWATVLDGAPRCGFLGRDISPAVSRAFTNFYRDRDGIRSRLVATWGRLASEFATTSSVAGFDLMNEPGYGDQPPLTSSLLLGSYYDRAITAIRDAERKAGGFPHLIFFEPSVLWSGMGFDPAPPPGFSDDPNLVFAPHPYNESITMDQGLGLTMVSIERGLDLAQRMAERYGAALWPGEWGWFGDPAADGAKVARYGAAEDRHMIGGAFWVWKQACGDPHAYPGTAATGGNLMIVDCASGRDLPPPAQYVSVLSRAYPRAVPGRLTSLTATGRRLRLTGTAAHGSCELDLWIPGTARPSVVATAISRIDLRQAPGGWRVTGCASGRYALTTDG